MNLREPRLSPGWYPQQENLIREFLEPFAASSRPARAAIAPHAGWHYSGIPAAKAVSALDRQAETVAIIGGHLPAGMPILAAEEDAVKTPLGVMEIDRELRREFAGRLSAVRADRYPDNTVEVLLPMVHYFFPRAALLWLRFPAEISSCQAGKLLAESAGKIRRRIAVLASTDLTHYGESFGYSPKGKGKPALEWMKTVNDAAFINAVIQGNPAEILKQAGENRSACGAGAVLGALGFAAACGETEARLLDYRTSAEADDETPDSFVGYAAMGIY